MKKKGLIISTIAMVAVLVASLSTATYAWFSSTAKATIDGVSITTVAASGLEIGVKAGDGEYFSGNITYDSATGKFGGDLDNWGSLADFSALTAATGVAGNLGSMDKATTVASADNYYLIATITKTGTGDTATYTADTFTYNACFDAAEVKFYVRNATNAPTAGAEKTAYDLGRDNGYLPIAYCEVLTNTHTNTEDNSLVTDGKFTVTNKVDDSVDVDATKVTYANAITALGKKGFTELYASFKAGDMLVPIAHDTRLVPSGFVKATANQHYLDLPLSVRSLIPVKAIFCTVTVTPEQNEMKSVNYMPGMAAASRIEIASYDRANKGSFEPYSSDATGGNVTTTNSGLAGYTAGRNAVFKYAIAYSATDGIMIPPQEAYDLVYKIWIEGSDLQCILSTAGSKFTIDIAYGYTETGTISATANSITIAGDNSANGEYSIIPNITVVKTVG